MKFRLFVCPSFVFSKLEKLENFLGCNIIVSGDFNISIEKLKSSAKGYSVSYDDHILNIIEIVDLVDI